MFVFKCPVHRVAKDAKNPKAEAALARLGTFLDNSSPQLVEWLYSLFQDQQKAVTYAELREAWLDGYESLIREWQEDYARFIADKLAPEIRKAAAAGGNAVLDGLGPNAFYIIDSDEAVKEWISTHTAELVTNISDSARKAINAIVLRGQTEGWTTDRMAYAIRPVIGLTKPQAQANENYFQHVLDTIREARPNISDTDASRMASEAALKYAAQQHRYRANMIANTELAYAYNNGAHETTRKAIQEGLMGACVKIWSTAADSRVCPICQDLDGMQVGFDGYFGEKEKNHGRGFTMLPPAHPGCRCAVLYEEISPARVTLPSAGKEDIITFREAENISGANEFATNVLGVQKASYKGCDVATANAWNESLTNAFNQFPELKKSVAFVGEAHERNQEMRAMVYQYMLDEVKRQRPAYTLEQILPTVKDLTNREMRRHTIGKKVYGQSWVPTGFYKDFRGTVVNRVYGKDAAVFLAELKKDVANKWHPIGCDTIKSVADHEIGHLLDDLLGLSKMKEVQALYDSRVTFSIVDGKRVADYSRITEDLSKYAWDGASKKDYSEFVAEAWAEYKNNPQPREIAKKIGEIVEREYEKKFHVKGGGT